MVFKIAKFEFKVTVTIHYSLYGQNVPRCDPLIPLFILRMISNDTESLNFSTQGEKKKKKKSCAHLPLLMGFQAQKVQEYLQMPMKLETMFCKACTVNLNKIIIENHSDSSAIFCH